MCDIHNRHHTETWKGVWMNCDVIIPAQSVTWGDGSYFLRLHASQIERSSSFEAFSKNCVCILHIFHKVSLTVTETLKIAIYCSGTLRQKFSILHYLVLSCTILHYSALSCTILHYLALSCTILQWCPVVPIRYTCSQQMSPVIAFI